MRSLAILVAKQNQFASRDLRINRQLLVNLGRSARISSSMVHPVQRRSIALISCLEQERCLMPRRNNTPTYRLRGIDWCGYLCAGESERVHVCLRTSVQRLPRTENRVYPDVSLHLTFVCTSHSRSTFSAFWSIAIVRRSFAETPRKNKYM